MSFLRSCQRFASQSKWGFIVYRCDYRSDDAWEQFVDGWSELTKKNLRLLNSPDMIQTLDFTVRADRGSLDGASVERVQEIFTEWTRLEDAKAEEKDAEEKGTWGYSRYWFCIHVDAPALDGCLRYLSLPEDQQLKYLIQPPFRNADLGQTPYVNIVRKHFHIEGCAVTEELEPEEEEGQDDDEEGEVIAVKMHLPLVLPGAFSSLMDNPFLLDDWARYCEDDGVSLS